MSAPFSRWSDRISATNDDAARRGLLSEIARWRTQHLLDIGAQRDASHALAQIYMLLGQRDRAVQEAHSLVSLCRTPPEARAGEMRAANAFLQSLGGTSVASRAPRAREPKRTGREREPRGRDRDRDRDVRGQKGRNAPVQRNERPADPTDRALELGLRGDWAGTLAALGERRGHRSQILRTWARLGLAVGGHADGLQQAFDELSTYLGPRAQGDAAPDRAAPRDSRPAPQDEAPTALSRLLGRRVPRRRDARLHAFEQFATDHPDRVDELAYTALRDHLDQAGAKQPAPWLATFVTRATLAAPEGSTATFVTELQAQGVFAVSAYQEPAYVGCLEVLRAADGWSVRSVRRGAMSRGAPAERRVWTARMVKDDVERMLVVAPPSDAPYADEALPGILASRLVQLCPRTVLVAEGPGNDALRAAAEAVGVSTVQGSPADVLAALEAVEAVVVPESAHPGRRDNAAASDAGPNPVRLIAELLGADEAPEVDALVPPLEQLRRLRGAFDAWRSGTGERSVADQESRLVLLLEAMHRVAPPTARLPQGTTLAVSVAVRDGATGVADALLCGDGAGARFGGAGMPGLLALAREAASSGWSIDRVLRGVTRREQRSNPVLETLGDGADGLWRLIVAQGDKRGEIWLVGALPAEGMAALPQLLLEERPRVLAVSPAVEGVDELGVPVVRWTGSEGEQLRAAVAAW